MKMNLKNSVCLKYPDLRNFEYFGGFPQVGFNPLT